METCLYNGKQICAYDVTNVNYALNYDLKKEWKIAGKVGRLICEECGKEVQLRVNDPRKKVPHFSHKSTDDRCPFSSDALKESEEHKRGKMLLYNYFKERYPITSPIINFRFQNKRRADLYIEFNNGDKLVVEYQRTELDILEWQERHAEYEKLNINVLWLLSGNEEKIRLKEKQIEVTFFQQIMLNELDKIAVYLDVNRAELIFSKNMRYSDPYVIGNDFEELYTKTYKLSDVIIHTNGKIECNFIDEYKNANEEFTSHYAKKCLDEEDLRNWEKEEEKRLKEESFKRKLEESRKSNSIREIQFDKSPVENKIRYCDGDMPYKNKIKYAANGDENSIEFVAKHLREWGISDDLKVISLISKYHYLKVNIKIKDVYAKIMERSGFGYSNLEVPEKNVSELVCPFCKGKLIQKYGKFGPFVYCSNYPQCKFSFNI